MVASAAASLGGLDVLGNNADNPSTHRATDVLLFMLADPPPLKFSSVDAPVNARTICGVVRAQLGADFCPAFGAAIQRRGPVWEFADRVQI
jgi:hypothetical protein